MTFSMLMLLIGSIAAQKKSPVSWKFELQKVNANKYELIATATMEPLWVLYSQFTDDSGPIPTNFTIDGKIIELKEKGKLITEMDPIFEVEVKKFKNKAIFSTYVTKGTKPNLSGSVEYMTCDGERCLPPHEVKFNLAF